MKDSRTHFTDLLRGIAAIGVMCSHLALMYYTGGASSAFSYMLPVAQESSAVSRISIFLDSYSFSLGPFAVALFFSHQWVRNQLFTGAKRILWKVFYSQAAANLAPVCSGFLLHFYLHLAIYHILPRYGGTFSICI